MEISEVKFIQTRGMIVKEERVKSLSDKILGNTLVLENYEPFPGYFGNHLPQDIKPRSIFLTLSKELDELKLSRLLQYIGKERAHKCNTTTGWIEIKGNRIQCIRINSVACFAEVSTVQEMLQRNGVELMKYKQIDENVLIHLNKTFSVELKTPDIFFDLYDNSMFYFSIKHELMWGDFLHINSIVKNNVSNNNYDAAIGFFWTFEGPLDIIRIYDKQSNYERIKELHDKYNHEIERWMKEHH